MAQRMSRLPMIPGHSFLDEAEAALFPGRSPTSLTPTEREAVLEEAKRRLEVRTGYRMPRRLPE